MAIHPDCATCRSPSASLTACKLVETPDLLWGVGRTGWDPWNTLRRTPWIRSTHVRRHPHGRHASGGVAAGALGPQGERGRLGRRLDRLVGAGRSDDRARRAAGPDTDRAAGAMVRGEAAPAGGRDRRDFPRAGRAGRGARNRRRGASCICRPGPIRRPFATTSVAAARDEMRPGRERPLDRISRQHLPARCRPPVRNARSASRHPGAPADGRRPGLPGPGFCQGPRHDHRPPAIRENGGPPLGLRRAGPATIRYDREPRPLAVEGQRIRCRRPPDGRMRRR